MYVRKKKERGGKRREEKRREEKKKQKERGEASYLKPSSDPLKRPETYRPSEVPEFIVYLFSESACLSFVHTAATCAHGLTNVIGNSIEVNF